MTIIALDLPENISQWPAWLEQQVVGLDLRQLVRQLEVIAGPGDAAVLDESSTEKKLRDLLGDELGNVLNSGLGALSADNLKKLIQRPRLLLALQEIVFIEGGAYWQSVPRTPEHQRSADMLGQQVLASLDVAPGGQTESRKSSELLPAVGSQTVRVSDASSTAGTSRRGWMALVALAAGLMLMLVLWQANSNQGRYFARAGLLTSSQTGNPFAKSMAKAVKEDWQRASEPKRLATELTALRDSCNLAIAADLDQLGPTVAADFKVRCGKWRDVFSECLKDLEAGQSEADVYKKANATVDRLITVLNELG